MEKQRTYYCVDMKSFFASVECAERGLDPMTTPLVVADETRGRGALCLAVSPYMKKLGVKNRCRLFDIPQNIEYTIAKPRMKKYIEYAADIYELYLDFFSPSDIHVYSIDECFLDATSYLETYKTTPVAFAKRLLEEIKLRKRIPATAGIGTNLYLAKIALDITAKKSPEGVGFLDEDLYRKTLWDHSPLTDFWQISYGTVKRLKKHGIYTMKDLALASETKIYKEFGINAEILIDHAFGREPCTIADIKNYKKKTSSVSFSQILFNDYRYDKAELVLKEMVLSGCQELIRRKVVAENVGIFIGYSSDALAPTGGTIKIPEKTSSFNIIKEYALKIFRDYTDKSQPIRRISVCFGSVLPESLVIHDLITDSQKLEREKKTEQAVIAIKDKFGKNALLRGMDLQEGATAITRNGLIGGHNGE